MHCTSAGVPWPSRRGHHHCAWWNAAAPQKHQINSLICDVGKNQSKAKRRRVGVFASQTNFKEGPFVQSVLLKEALFGVSWTVVAHHASRHNLTHLAPNQPGSKKRVQRHRTASNANGSAAKRNPDHNRTQRSNELTN